MPTDNPFLLENNNTHKISGIKQRETEGEPYGAGFLSFDINKNNIFFFKILIFIIIVILEVLLINLQFSKGEYYKNLAEGNRIRIQEISALRGLIYDRNNELLADNLPNFNLIVTPVDLPRDKELKKEFKNQLANLFPEQSLFFDKTFADLNTLTPPLILVKNIPFEKAILIEVQAVNWPGVSLEKSIIRNYLQAELVSHILGYTGPVNQQDLTNNPLTYQITDIIGKDGIEFFYEDELRGKKGSKKIEVNAWGKEQKVIEIKDSKKGKDLILTIDLNIQRQLTEIIQDYQKKFHSERAVGIAINPQNGEIIALVSLPSYNNNNFSLGISNDDFQKILDNPNKPLFNRAISGEYPPGSTFKLVVGAAALEEGIIDQNWTFNSTGGLRVGEWFFPDWAAGGHGVVNIKRAIAWSVNSFFYTISGGYENFNGLGVDKINFYAQKFGIGDGLAIDLPNESAGFLPNKQWKQKEKQEAWYLGDTYHLSIGQGDLRVTPIEVAGWTMVFANSGKLFSPYLLKSKIFSQGVLETTAPKAIRENFLKAENIEIIRQGMRDAVIYGGSQLFKNLKIETAAKTGTAQNPNGEPHGWWTGFAPYDNPEIVVTILMENAGGSEKASAVAYDFLKWYFDNLKFKI